MTTKSVAQLLHRRHEQAKSKRRPSVGEPVILGIHSSGTTTTGSDRPPVCASTEAEWRSARRGRNDAGVKDCVSDREKREMTSSSAYLACMALGMGGVYATLKQALKEDGGKQGSLNDRTCSPARPYDQATRRGRGVTSMDLQVGVTFTSIETHACSRLE